MALFLVSLAVWIQICAAATIQSLVARSELGSENGKQLVYLHKIWFVSEQMNTADLGSTSARLIKEPADAFRTSATSCSIRGGDSDWKIESLS